MAPASIESVPLEVHERILTRLHPLLDLPRILVLSRALRHALTDLLTDDLPFALASIRNHDPVPAAGAGGFTPDQWRRLPPVYLAARIVLSKGFDESLVKRLTGLSLDVGRGTWTRASPLSMKSRDGSSTPPDLAAALLRALNHRTLSRFPPSFALSFFAHTPSAHCGEVLTRLLAFAPVASDILAALTHAVRSDNAPAVEALLSSNLVPAESYPLRSAVVCGRLQAAMEMVRRGGPASVGVMDHQAFRIAVMKGYKDLVGEMVRVGGVPEDVREEVAAMIGGG
ncbi:hypothetical protein HK101_003286, partial [Irineochytrium annulatum]